MRVALAGAAAMLLCGCGAINWLFFPHQQVNLLNRSTVAVDVRIGPFKAGEPMVTDAEAIARLTLQPGETQTQDLPLGHLAVYAQAQTPQAEDAANDFTTTRDKPVSLVLDERLEDRTGDKNGPGYRVRQLGWTVQ